MHSIQIHRTLNKLVSFYYLMGIWYRGKVPTVRENMLRTFYVTYLLSALISLIVVAATNETIEAAIFPAESAVVSVVLCVKLWIFIRNQKRILDLLNQVCVFSIRNYEDFKVFERKLEKFMKFASIFLRATFYVYTFALAVGPFVGAQKKLLVDFALPFDYKNNEIAFWIAYAYLTTDIYLNIVVTSTSVVIWYLMFHCSLRYEVLGSEITRMGRKKQMKEDENYRNFLQDLTASVDSHRHLKGIIDEVASFTTNLFFIQFATSGLCICGSVYCLAFDVGVNLLERMVHVYTLLYHLAELFMITYFGNEIKLSSSRLSYSLFESDWIEQSQSTKKCITIFAEHLKQPHVLVIGKIYPLMLGTFSRILKLAYSLFNILKGTIK